MSRRLATVAFTAVTFVLVAMPALAQEAGEATQAAVSGNWAKFLGAAFAIGFAAALGGIGQGRAISAACEAMGRNPGAAGPIRITMIIGLALIESLVIYALIIAFILAK